MDKHNSNFMTGGPWYDTYICKKIHGNLLEGFIINARTDRYNIIFFIDAHEKKYLSERDDGSSGGGYPLPSNSTTEALYLLSATIDFIDCCLKVLEHNLLERFHMYIFAMIFFWKSHLE